MLERELHNRQIFQSTHMLAVSRFSFSMTLHAYPSTICTAIVGILVEKKQD
jgi:hypothetical protein